VTSSAAVVQAATQVKSMYVIRSWLNSRKIEKISKSKKFFTWIFI